MLTILILIGLIAVALLWKIKGTDVAIFIFMVLLPMKSMVHQSDMLLGVLSPDEIATAVLLVLIPLKYNKLLTKRLDFQKKNAFLFYFFFNFSFFYYKLLKSIFLLNEVTFRTDLFSIKTLISNSSALILLYLLIKLLDNEKIYLVIEKGLIISSIILGFSIFFAEPLLKLGFAPDIGIQDSYFETTNRPSGFFSNDANVAGMYCVINFIFILVQILFNKRRNKLYYAALILLFLGVMKTGSRASFIALIVSSILMVVKLRNNKNFMRNISIGILFSIVFYFLYSSYGSSMQQRFAFVKEGGNIEDTSLESRIEYWKTYLGDILENPHYLLIGNLRPPPIKRGTHNFFIMLLYFSGIFPFLLCINYLIKFFRYPPRRNMNKYRFPLLYPLLACVIVLFTVPDVPPFNLAMVIAMSAGLTVKKPLVTNQKEISAN